MWLINTFDNFSEYYKLFKHSEIVENFQQYTVKKSVHSLSKYYGVFDTDELIGYFWLIPFYSKYQLWQGFEVRVDPRYQKQGIGTFLYRYTVTKDKLSIVTDYSHSISISKMWEKFCTMPDMQVYSFNHLADELCPINIINDNQIYGNDHMHLVVGPK